jgi:hypothetical protein
MSKHAARAPLSYAERGSNRPLEPLFGADPFLTRSDALRLATALPGRSRTRALTAARHDPYVRQKTL